MSVIEPILTKRCRIGVIGAGISGLGAAWALRNVHDVTVFEKRDWLGGHANTVRIDYDGSAIDVDTGFIVYNTLNYPNFTPFLDALGVESFHTDMSFGFSLDRRLEWSSNGLAGIFADPANLLRPEFLGMLRDILRFNKAAQNDLAEGKLAGLSLGQYLDRLGVKSAFRKHYLLPMGAAIWSSTETEMEAYPAEAFIKFFNNHRLMHAKRPKWSTIKGGSQSYVHQVQTDLKLAHVNFAPEAVEVSRTPEGVRVTNSEGQTTLFDEVILACHSNQALKLLSDADTDERELLSAIPYAPNRAVLHRDQSLIPERKGAHAAWTYLREAELQGASVSYDMNRLQGIASDKPLYVTLNPAKEPDPALVFSEHQYDHPQFTTAGTAAQRIFNRVQGVRNTWFAGAWLGYGFHEDGLRSGLRAALRLGGQIPWTFVEGDVTGGPWGERSVSQPELATGFTAAE